MKKYVLELTEDQLRILSVASEFYARVRMGQFKEIVWHCLEWKGGIDDLCNRRDEAERLLLEARKQIYPELHGVGHSYGVGRFKDADRAFDIHQVARHALGDEREPWSLNGDLPSIKVVEKPDL